MPLLIEIKFSGNDSDNHVQRFLTEYESFNLTQPHIFHSFDSESVADLKRLRPDFTVALTEC